MESGGWDFWMEWKGRGIRDDMKEKVDHKVYGISGFVFGAKMSEGEVKGRVLAEGL